MSRSYNKGYRSFGYLIANPNARSLSMMIFVFLQGRDYCLSLLHFVVLRLTCIFSCISCQHSIAMFIISWINLYFLKISRIIILKLVLVPYIHSLQVTGSTFLAFVKILINGFLVLITNGHFHKFNWEFCLLLRYYHVYA